MAVVVENFCPSSLKNPPKFKLIHIKMRVRKVPPSYSTLADLLFAIVLSLSVSSVHYLSCLTLPSFLTAVHFQIKFTLNELFDANKPSQDLDEKEEPKQHCIPSELKTNCLLIDSFQLECSLFHCLLWVHVILKPHNRAW